MGFVLVFNYCDQLSKYALIYAFLFYLCQFGLALLLLNDSDSVAICSAIIELAGLFTFLLSIRVASKLQKVSQTDSFSASDTQKSNPKSKPCILENIDCGIIILSNQLDQVFFMNKHAKSILKTAMATTTIKSQSALALIKMSIFERCSFRSEDENCIAGTGKFFSITQLITDIQGGNFESRKSRIYKVSN